MADGAQMPTGFKPVVIRDAKLAATLMDGRPLGNGSHGVLQVHIPGKNGKPGVTRNWPLDEKSWDQGRDEPKESA